MTKIAATAVLVTLLTAARPVWAADQLVLIVSADSKVEQLDSLEVRKLFLGLTVTYNGDRLRPVLDEADARIKEIFLQNIVSMSDTTYDRSVLRLALIQGQVILFRELRELAFCLCNLRLGVSDHSAPVGESWTSTPRSTRVVRTMSASA